MVRFRDEFDPVRYWANKPLCLVCKQRKVKYGNICGECQKEGSWDQKIISQDNVDVLKTGKLVKQFESPKIERKEAPQVIKSIVGYLKDCASAILRNTSLIDITNTQDVSFFSAPKNAFDLLENNGFAVKEKQAFDFLYKVTSRPNEFDLLLGTLFLKGTKSEREKKTTKICAPLLYVKLEANKGEDNKTVIFSLKEDTVFLNQTLISAVVDITDEEELEVRFQDFYENQPTWPLSLESSNQFLQSLSNSFPEIFKDTKPKVRKFLDFGDIDIEKGKIVLCPSNVLILAPKQGTEGTVVEELNQMLQRLLDHTGVDYIFAENLPPTSNLSEQEAQDATESFDDNKSNEEWHNLWPIDLSDGKKKIVRSTRTNALTVVSGPPGTGKSYTIAAVLLDHLLAGRRVLFVSRMDKAVEVVVSWLEGFGGPFIVARSGGRNAQRTLAEKLEVLTGANSPVQSVDKKQLEELEARYAEIQAKVKDLEENFLELVSQEREWSKVFESIKEIKKQIQTDADFSRLKINQSKGKQLKENVNGADALLKHKTFFLLTWWGRTTMHRVKKILGVSEDTTTEELLHMLDKIIQEDKRREIEEELSKFGEVNKLWVDIQVLNENLHSIAQEVLKRSLLGNLYLIVNNHHKRIEIRNFIQSLRAANLRRKITLKQKVSTDTLLSAFPCWASTTGHLSQILPLEAGMFDLVIFDEASQCDLASALPALYRGNRALIVGDPKQLTHVVFLGKQTEFAAFANNKVPTEIQSSYRFTQRSLFDVAEDKVPQQNYFMLDEHFRSDPHIISFSNRKFYENKLRIMTQRPVIGGNSHAIEVDYVKGKRTEGTVNPVEIEAVFRHVNKIISSSNPDNPTTVGILCPFRDQVDAISKELPKFLTLDQVSKHKIVIGTAHSLQGDEKDVVILSLSISPDFHHGTLHFLEKPSVFNVAITRAKKRLIVISSVQISDLPNGLLKDFLIHAESSIDQTIPLDKFDSKFEKEVADALVVRGLKVWPQYESAGFNIDLVVGDGDDFIAVECDGPSHYDLKSGQNYHDVWRQKILERARWRFVRISYREWERDRKSCIEKVLHELATLK